MFILKDWLSPQQKQSSSVKKVRLRVREVTRFHQFWENTGNRHTQARKSIFTSKYVTMSVHFAPNMRVFYGAVTDLSYFLTFHQTTFLKEQETLIWHYYSNKCQIGSSINVVYYAWNENMIEILWFGNVNLQVTATSLLQLLNVPIQFENTLSALIVDVLNTVCEREKVHTEECGHLGDHPKDRSAVVYRVKTCRKRLVREGVPHPFVAGN